MKKSFYLIWVFVKEKAGWEKLLVVDKPYSALLNVLTLRALGHESVFYVSW